MSAARTLRPLFPIIFLAAFSALPAMGQSAMTIPKDALVQPAVLHEELQANPRAALILQVGSRMMFDQDHIPGAEYVGPGSRPEGLEALRARVKALPRIQAIVLYCGCCPWDRCPNVAPAWALLHQMGFTRLRVLYLASNFGADWMARGYGVQPSH
jgi:thiosulfate/3-mercaptopyruvate sulfurtransferase